MAELAPEQLVAALRARTTASRLQPDQVISLLRPLLDGLPVRPLVEYLAERAGETLGERQLIFSLSDGDLRRSHLPRGPIGNDELERLCRVL